MWWVYSFMKTERQQACQDPCCMDGTLERREHWQRRGCWEQRPQWHQRHNWRIHSATCQGSEESSAGGEHCYHCSSPEHFIYDCPLVKAISRTDLYLNQKGGGGADEGSPGPSRKGNHAKDTLRQDTKSIGHHM